MNAEDIANRLLHAACDAALKHQHDPDANHKVINAIRRDPLWPAFVQLVDDDIILDGPPLTAHLVAIANREPTDGLTEHRIWALFVHEF